MKAIVLAVQQEARAQGGGDGEERLGVPSADAIPSRDRERDLVPETLLRLDASDLARCRVLQVVRVGERIVGEPADAGA